jgi:ribosomal protein S12 methylthiotransferase accessory factor
MSMQISFPGGVSVASTFKGHTIVTDQPVAAGGRDTAPAPFDLFLASIGTCAGFYALRFCQERNIDTTDLSVELDVVKDVEKKRVGTIKIELTLPPGFPEKYNDAIRRAVDQCAVKRHIIEPPAFEVIVVESGSLVESVE